MSQDRNLVTFHYADGSMPVAQTEVMIVALGKNSSQPWRPAMKDSILDNEIIIWETITGSRGELWLNSQEAWPGVALVQQNIKRRFPSKRAWDFPPSSLDSRVFSDPLFPKVPLQIELNDVGFSPTRLTFPLTPTTGKIVTTWDRPPLAIFDSSDFRNATEYLEYLAERYSYLESIRPQHLTLGLRRMGSRQRVFALRTLFGQLALMLGANSWSLSRASVKDALDRRDRIAQRVCRELAGVLSVPTGKGVRASYLSVLYQVADLSKRNRLLLQIDQVIWAIFRGFGFTPDSRLVVMPDEDYAAVGTMLFLLGAIPYGYKWGTLSHGMSWSTWSFDAVVSNSTTCSQDEFHPHCELMRP